MASHTASDLRIAARVLSDVVSGMGLEPAAIGPPRIERQAPDVEPYAPDLEPFIPDLEPDIAAAELDAELDAGRERLAAAVRSRSQPPFDAERMVGAGEVGVPAGAGTSDAPFDIERETAVPRAA